MPHRKIKILILGAGAGGISVAAKLKKSVHSSDIVIVEPNEKHFYQPMWTLAGAGINDKEDSEREQKDVLPSDIEWIKDSVMSISPEQNKVQLQSGEVLSYEFLIIATGLRLRWDLIPGAQETLGKNGVCTIYDYEHVDKTSEMIQTFTKGTALFVMPAPPIKCAGAPQKIMYLAEHIFRNNQVRENINIQFATAGKTMFGVPVFANALADIAKRKNIQPLYSHKISAVDGHQKIAEFEVTDETGKISKKQIPFDLLHLVPPMSAHPFISDNKTLSFQETDQKGWLAVDKFTLQHMTFKNIFGIGDVTGIPNSKTAAAVRNQYPIVAKNLLSVMNGEEPQEKYNGYSSCPLITEIGKVMLAEFGYDGKLLPTFPLDPLVERRTMWFLKTEILPLLYWNGMMNGLM